MKRKIGIADDDGNPKKSKLHDKWMAKSRGLQKSNIMFRSSRAKKIGTSAEYEMNAPLGYVGLCLAIELADFADIDCYDSVNLSAMTNVFIFHKFFILFNRVHKSR